MTLCVDSVVSGCKIRLLKCWSKDHKARDEQYANQTPILPLWSFMSSVLIVLNVKLRKGSFPALVSARLVSRIRRGKSVQENIHINSSLTHNFFAHDTFILFLCCRLCDMMIHLMKTFDLFDSGLCGAFNNGFNHHFLSKEIFSSISWFDDDLFFDLYVIPCSAHQRNLVTICIAT